VASYNFQDLQVWQRSMKLVETTYVLIIGLPKHEQFALADQMRRCAVSIPSNIAEGQKRLSNKETVQFSSIALGSLGELQTQLILCNRLYGLDTSNIVDECEQITKMLTTLIRSLRTRV
jgi:four helix bundle protein